MTCVEHTIENALFAIHRKKTFEEWLMEEQKRNLPEVKSDPAEIWQMAIYVYYSPNWDKQYPTL